MSAGEIVLITGPQGAGKTTVAAALTNALLQQGISVSRFLWDGARPEQQKAMQRDIAQEAKRGRCVIVESCDAPQIRAHRFIDIRRGTDEGRPS